MFTFVLHILSSRNITKNMLLHKITPNFTTPVEALVGHVILEVLEIDFPSNGFIHHEFCYDRHRSPIRVKLTNNSWHSILFHRIIKYSANLNQQAQRFSKTKVLFLVEVEV